jgi:hypothetical protein
MMCKCLTWHGLTAECTTVGHEDGATVGGALT